MSLNQFLVILRARWLIAVTVFLSVVVLIAFASIIWPKQYTATASIVIDNKSDPVTAGAGAAAGMQPQATYVDTEADIIASERVAQRVVKTLKLDQQPEARKLWAKGPNDDISVTIADLLLKRKLQVAPAHDSPTHVSNVIDISVQWSDPVTAAALANEMVFDFFIFLRASADPRNPASRLTFPPLPRLRTPLGLLSSAENSTSTPCEYGGGGN